MTRTLQLNTFNKMKKALFIIAFLLSASPIWATTYYISSAGNNSDGLTWTNAYTSFANAGLHNSVSSSPRGHKYYVGNGNFGSLSLKNAESGSSVITITKATVADHGTEEGWTAGLAAQAVLGSGITFLEGYYTIDGNGSHTVPSDNTNDYGFKVSANSYTDYGGIIAFGPGGGVAVSNITFKYVHVYNTYHSRNMPLSYNQTVMVRFEPTVAHSYIKLQNCYFQNSGKDGIQISSSRHILVERNYVERLGKYPEAGFPNYDHGQTIQAFQGDNLIFRWNIWEACEGESLLSMAWENDDIRFYGNVIFNKYGETTVTWGFNHSIVGDISDGSPGEAGPIRTYVYNNTIVNVGGDYGLNAAMNLYESRGNNFSYNNLWYNAENLGYSGGDWTASHDASGGGDSPGVSNEQTGLASSIFTDYTGNDLTLASDLNAGLDLEAQGWWDTTTDTSFWGQLDYNADMYGNAYDTDGTWDRGAYSTDSPNGAETPANVIQGVNIN